jgi:hypothetical protein
MRRWLDPKWYGFLWQRKDRRGLAVVLVVLAAALGAGGYAAASSMKSNNTAVGIVKIAEIKHKVRVHGREKVVTQYVTLATTEVAKPSTVVQTRVVTHPVVKTVHVQGAPVVRRQLVTIKGKGVTVTRRLVLTQHQTLTQPTTETSFQTVTQPSTVVQSKTVTRRVTTTEPGTTATVTVTGAVLTVTVTKTVTRTTTVTVTGPTTTK